MKMKKLLPIFIALVIICFGYIFWRNQVNRIPEDDFLAPGKSWQSPKKVEDYFVEKLRFTQADLDRQMTATGVAFRPTKDSTIDAIISNLHYYGFIRSEKALRYALENTEDKTQASPGALWVGKNGSVDTNASYTISENMTAWEMADTLLNKSHYFGPSDEYGYMFMP
jgi:hypothetical protein